MDHHGGRRERRGGHQTWSQHSLNDSVLSGRTCGVMYRSYYNMCLMNCLIHQNIIHNIDVIMIFFKRECVTTGLWTERIKSTNLY